MAKKSRTGGSAADFARRSNAVSRMNAAPRGGRPSRFEDIKMMAPYMGLDPSVSPRPMPRPVMTERGSRFDEGMTREEMERGSSAPGRSMRPTARPQRFEKGGKVDGFPDLNKDGKVTKADVLRGRGVEGFAMGGMVRGVKPAQVSGTKFSGTF